MKKKIFLLFIFCLSLSAETDFIRKETALDWPWIYSAAINKDGRGVCTVGAGYPVCSIFATEDGGDSWTLQSKEQGDSLDDEGNIIYNHSGLCGRMYMFSDSIVFFHRYDDTFGENTQNHSCLYYSEDAGRTFQKTFIKHYLTERINMLPSGHGIITTYDSIYLHTTDHGKTWQERKLKLPESEYENSRWFTGPFILYDSNTLFIELTHIIYPKPDPTTVVSRKRYMYDIETGLITDTVNVDNITEAYPLKNGVTIGKAYRHPENGVYIFSTTKPTDTRTGVLISKLVFEDGKYKTEDVFNDKDWSVSYSRSVTDVEFIGDVGMMCGHGGTLFVTTDGGKTWRNRSSDLGTQSGLDKFDFQSVTRYGEDTFVLTTISDHYTVKISFAPSSVEEGGYEFHIYPNPAVNILDIGLQEFDDMKIYDTAGKEYSFPVPQGSGIDISGLPAGIYHLVIEKQRQTIRKRFVKSE